MSAMPAAPGSTFTTFLTGNQSFVPFHPPMTGPPDFFCEFASIQLDMTRASNQFLSPRTTSVYFTSAVIVMPSYFDGTFTWM